MSRLTVALGGSMNPIDSTTFPIKRVLTMEAARSLADRALEVAAGKGIHYVVISVVDDGGHLVVLLRPNKAEPAAVEIGIAKARTAAITRKPTKWWMDMLNSGVEAFLKMPNVTPVGGGHPIVVDGQVVGAISAAGGSFEDDDEICLSALAILR